MVRADEYHEVDVEALHRPVAEIRPDILGVQIGDEFVRVVPRRPVDDGYL